MDLPNDVLTLLNRCTAMNCLYEGQSFSRNAFSGLFGETGRNQVAIQAMVENGLVVKSPTGSFSLTSVGADARPAAAAAAKTKVLPKEFHRGRPPSTDFSKTVRAG